MSDQVEDTATETTQDGPPDAGGRPEQAAAKARPARAAKPAADKTSEEAPAEEPKVTRREFLNYIWGATMVLLLAETTGISLLFAFPRFREGEFGGVFSLGRANEILPDESDPPQANDVGKYWLIQSDEGVLALYKVCTHLGCLYKWIDATDRFECPCHGSKFTKKGEWIEGPAPRNLDRFVIEAVDESGAVVATTDTNGDPLPLPGENLELRIDTGKRIMGKVHA